jgi:hypothetical protein
MVQQIKSYIFKSNKLNPIILNVINYILKFQEVIS